MRAPFCDPDLPPASGHLGARDTAFRLVHDVGHGNLDLTRLNHAAHMLAVYASQCRLPETPRKTRFQLVASLCWAGLHPPGPNKRFPVTS